MLQDVERFLKVRITVAVVGAEPVAGEMSLGSFVQAGGQLVRLSVSRESVGTPASGAVPHSAATGCIDVDADDEGVVRLVAVTDGDAIDATASFFQGDVLLFEYDERCVVASELEMLDDGAGNQAIVLVLPEPSVPEAIICFLESDSFEDAIRKAVSIGGDSDTLACITGGIAEAYYAFIPQEMINRTVRVFPKIFNKILDEFRTRTEYGM